jgi:hypothetical protein
MSRYVMLCYVVGDLGFILSTEVNDMCVFFFVFCVHELIRYRSAISGPVNLVIIVDVSRSEKYDATLRLERQKEAALLLLESLNYWSFFNVGLYTDSSSFFAGSNTMIRATSENKASAASYIRSLSLDGSAYVSLESSLKGVLDLIESSESGGDSTFCHSLVVFLATDHNDLASSTSVPSVIDAYSSEGNLVIMSFVFNFESYLVDPVYEEMSCRTDGFQHVITSSSYDDSVLVVVQKYSAFLAATLENTNVRYSEIYEDIQGVGELTTGMH